MILDMRTMYVVVAVTSLILGAVQLIALSTGRFGRWTAWWGLSNLLVGFGTLGIALRGTVANIVSIDLGNLATLAGFAFLVVGVRAFAGRAPRWDLWGLVALCIVCPIPLWHDPAAYGTRIAYLSVIAVVLDAAVVREGISLARRERLSSAWILVVLFGLTMLIFAVRAVSAATGHLGVRDLFFAERAGLHQWLAVTAAAFVTLRGVALIMMVSERDRNALLALAQRDPLTGVLNRGGLEQAFGRLVTARTGFSTGQISLLLIDIDRFKLLNDTYGHAAGDRMLRLFASAAQGRLRPQDILARQGGDEFVVMLPATTADEALRIADQIRQTFACAVTEHDTIRIPPTLSIGVANGNLVREGFETILQRADSALYRSKRNGRDRVEALTVGESQSDQSGSGKGSPPFQLLGPAYP